MNELFFSDPFLLSGSHENNKEWFICLNVSKVDKEKVHSLWYQPLPTNKLSSNDKQATKSLIDFSLRVHGDLGDQGEEGRVREAAEGGRVRRDGRGHQG